MSIQEIELKPDIYEDEVSSGEELEEEEDYNLTEIEAIEEVRDELSTIAELLEEMIGINQERLEQEKIFQSSLLAVLEKLAAK
jgi:hypothetical protein